MSITPDGPIGIGRIHERIVFRNTAVVVHTVNLAQPVLQILRVLHRAAFPEREEQMSLTIPGETRSEMHTARDVQLCRRSKDDLLIGPLVVLADLSAND